MDIKTGGKKANRQAATRLTKQLEDILLDIFIGDIQIKRWTYRQFIKNKDRHKNRLK